MNINCPTSVHVDKGEENDFNIDDTVYFTLTRTKGVVKKIGRTFLFIDTSKGMINVPKNKCELIE